MNNLKYTIHKKLKIPQLRIRINSLFKEKWG